MSTKTNTKKVRCQASAANLNKKIESLKTAADNLADKFSGPEKQVLLTLRQYLGSWQHEANNKGLKEATGFNFILDKKVK